MGHKERRLYDYANERTYLVNITRNACPELLDSLSDKTLFGKSVDCANHHIQLLLGLDVPVFDKKGDKVLGTVKLPIASSTGDESNRVLDFTANTLLPYMAGGRLNDIVGRVPRYQSMVVRYPLYVDVAPQMVEAVRYLHSIHIAHLGIQTSAILCSNIECEDAVLADPSVAWNGQGKASPYANELMQQSVRFSQFSTRDHSGEDAAQHDHAAPPSGEMTPVSKIFASYLNSTDWEAATKVDWYGLGGSLFYILGGIRPVAEDRAGPNSHDAAEFIYKALKSKQLLNKIPDEESKSALMKIRDQVAEGLLLVDGLLQTDRSKRISFDLSPNGLQRMQKTTNNLRSSKALMSSALQLGSQTSVPENSCANFISESTKASQTLAELPVQDKDSFPSFLQQICQ